MAIENHNTLNTKTLSAPNPISTIYKHLAFFDATAGFKLAFTHPTSLYDMEIVDISNPFNFTSPTGIKIKSLGGASPSNISAATENLSGDVSQLFKDIYGSIGQNVDLTDYKTGAGSYPEGSGMDDNYGVATEDTSTDKGLIYGLRAEAARRHTDISRLNTEVDGIQELLGGASWAWDAINDNASTFWSANIEPSSATYIGSTEHLKDALGELDNNLARNAIFIQGLYNLVTGTEGAATAPYTDLTLETSTWDGGNAPTLLNLGSATGTADGSRDTYYIYSDGNEINTRPDGSTDDTAVSVSLSSALNALDNELRREEMWSRKLTSFVDDTKSLTAASASGGSLAWDHNSTVWDTLDNISSGGTFQNYDGESTSLRDALNNLDLNMRLLQYKVERNLDEGGVSVSPDSSLTGNAARKTLQALRNDVNEIGEQFGRVAGFTSDTQIVYGSPAGDTYSSTDNLHTDINALDTQLEFVSLMISGVTTAGDQYGTSDWGNQNIKDDMATIHDEVISDSNSIKNRVAKVTTNDPTPVIQFSGDARIDSGSDTAHRLYLPGGHNFAGTEPFAGTDWLDYAANKRYVDNLVGEGVIFKPYVDGVALSNQDLSGTETIDGILRTAGKRILCAGQTDASENGVWVVASGAWTRPDDFDTGDEALRAWTYWVKEGTLYENTLWNIGGDNTGYTPIDTVDIDGITQMGKALGLQDGKGTLESTDKIHVNVGDSIYNDGTNGSVINVNLAGDGSSGSATGTPHTNSWSAGARSNKFNPIYYDNTGGENAGLALKYTTDFELDAAGNLKLAAFGGLSGDDLTWTYDITKYAESSDAGLANDGTSTVNFWDADHWTDLRRLTDASVGQAAALQTTGSPSFEGLTIDGDGGTDTHLVGIGTAPGGHFKLKIKGTDQSATLLHLENSAGAGAGYISFTETSSGYDPNDMKIGIDGSQLHLKNKQGDIALGTATGGASITRRMTVKGNVTDGVVGIGTSNPKAELEIWSDNSEAYHYPLMIRNPFNNQTDLDYGVGMKFLLDDAVDTKWAAIDYRADSSYGNTGDLNFWVDAEGATTPKMLITSDGSVGIGEANPVHVLEVKNDDEYKCALINRTHSNYANNLNDTMTRSGLTVRPSSHNEQFTISRVAGGISLQSVEGAYSTSDTKVAHELLLNPFGGDVGIGLIAPTGTLDIQKSAGCGMHIRTDGTNDASIWASSMDTEANARRDLNIYSRDLKFFIGASGTSSSTTEAMRISHTDGKIAIGDNVDYGHLSIKSPSGTRPLGIRTEDAGDLIRWNIGETIVGGVNSDGSGTGLYGGSTATNNHLFIDNSGNIGFGSATPAGDFEFSRLTHGSDTQLIITSDFDHTSDTWASVKDDNPTLKFRKRRTDGNWSSSTIGKHDARDLYTSASADGTGGQLLRYKSDVYHVFCTDNEYDVGLKNGPAMIVHSQGGVIIGSTQITPTAGDNSGVTPSTINTNSKLLIQSTDETGEETSRYQIGKTTVTSSYDATWDLNDSEMVFGHDSESHNISIKTNIDGTAKGMTIAAGSGNTVFDGSLSTTDFTTGSLSLGPNGSNANEWRMSVNNAATSELKLKNDDASNAMHLILVDGKLKMGSGGTTRISNAGNATFASIDLTESADGIEVQQNSNIVKWDSGAGNTQNGLFINGNDIVQEYNGSSVIYLRASGEVQCNNIDANSTTVKNTFANDIECDGDVIAYASSDERLKRNKRPIHHALDKVNSLSGVMFDWDEELQDSHSGTDIGVIAQEVEEVVPQIVATRDNGYKAVKYEKLVPLLIESIKELTNEVKELKGKCKCQ
tara:strand:+ start:6496 stop:11895 length:5400 start_codon:yes stop_codon:yes gene_type:complete